jgi:predicted aspartyl protease
MRATYLAAIFVLCVARFSQLFAAQTDFRFQDRLIHVKVSAPATGRTLDFVLDTGATESVISVRAARELGLKLGAARNVAAVYGSSMGYEVDRPGLEFAGMPVKNAMLALDLSGYNRRLHVPIDGLIGADFLRGKVLRIDYAARTVVISDSPSGSTADALPIRVISGALCIPVSVNGCAARWTRLDTGCNQNLVWTQTIQESRQGAATTIGLHKSGSPGSHIAVSMGSHSLGDVPAILEAHPLFGAEAGLVGNGILSRFVVEIDSRANRLVLHGSGR